MLTPMMKRCAVLLVAAILAAPASAGASVTPLWFAGQLAAGRTPTLSQASVFPAASGLAAQRVAGPVWWAYVKGSRSYKATWPESWYMHAGGVRVRDTRFGSFVMNPSSAGWDAVVAHACGGRCFVDGIGVSSMSRDRPRLAWSAAQWVAAVAVEMRYLVGHGQAVLPNSIGLQSASLMRITGRGSTESFSGLRDLALLRAGNVWVVGKRNCGPLLAAYLIGFAPGDLFACSMPGTLPWTVPAVMSGASLGSPLGAAVQITGGWLRRFQHGTVTALLNGSYRIVRSP